LKKKNRIKTAALVILFVALGGPAAAAATGTVEALPLEAATPTIATTDKAVSHGDMVPGDVKTMEDFQAPLEEARTRNTGSAGGVLWAAWG